jgi:hypothetical protein
MMVCAVHQPNYLPYPGFFDKLLKSDVFIIYDTAQFRKNNFQNRNRVCSTDGWQWLTVPVKHNFGQKIMDVEIENPRKSLKNNWMKIQTLYGKAPFFKQYSGTFENIYSNDYSNLAELNYDLITAICNVLNLNPKFIRSSSFGEIKSKSTEALIDMCKIAGADTYISGESGKNYLDTDLIKKSGISIIFQNFVQPVYKQFNNNTFQPNMSIIDLIFNCGSDSLKLISRTEKSDVK